MSNKFRGQPQYAQLSVGPLSAGGYGSPFGSSLGGRSTTFGGYGMGGAYGGGVSQPSLVPKQEPTVNDLFSQYFSKQYYGGEAFNPFSATSLFGGGYGGGFGGGRGDMGGRMRRRRQAFEDFFMPTPQPVANPAPAPAPELVPVPASAEPIMYAGGSPGFYSQQQPIMQPYQPTYQVAPMTEEDRIRARAAISSGALSAL